MCENTVWDEDIYKAREDITIHVYDTQPKTLGENIIFSLHVKKNTWNYYLALNFKWNSRDTWSTVVSLIALNNWIK